MVASSVLGGFLRMGLRDPAPRKQDACQNHRYLAFFQMFALSMGHFAAIATCYDWTASSLWTRGAIHASARVRLAISSQTKHFCEPSSTKNRKGSICFDLQ